MVSAIIVAAGRGTRMGPDRDKLFLEVAGKPVVAHAWERFAQAGCIDEIVVVVRDGMQDAFHEIAAKYSLSKTYSLVAGGRERQDSVWNGLTALTPGASLVAIHDGARPCTEQSLISDTVKAAKDCGAAVAAQRVTDTIKQSADGVWIDRTLDRSRLWSVQTPQCFRVDIIRRALSQVRERGLSITDDTAACEVIGQPVKLVASSRPNPKVTVPGDLAYVELLLKQLE